MFDPLSRSLEIEQPVEKNNTAPDYIDKFKDICERFSYPCGHRLNNTLKLQQMSNDTNTKCK